MVGRRRARHASLPSRSIIVGRRLPKLATVLHLPVVGLVPLQGTAQFEAFAALGELQAILARRLRPWSGNASLFLSDEDEAALLEARWGQLLTGSWASAKVPGGHIDMLERENIGVAAAVLREQIARVLRPRT